MDNWAERSEDAPMAASWRGLGLAAWFAMASAISLHSADAAEFSYLFGPEALQGDEPGGFSICPIDFDTSGEHPRPVEDPDYPIPGTTVSPQPFSFTLPMTGCASFGYNPFLDGDVTVNANIPSLFCFNCPLRVRVMPVQFQIDEPEFVNGSDLDGEPVTVCLRREDGSPAQISSTHWFEDAFGFTIAEGLPGTIGAPFQLAELDLGTPPCFDVRFSPVGQAQTAVGRIDVTFSISNGGGVRTSFSNRVVELALTGPGTVVAGRPTPGFEACALTPGGALAEVDLRLPIAIDTNVNDSAVLGPGKSDPNGPCIEFGIIANELGSFTLEAVHGVAGTATLDYTVVPDLCGNAALDFPEHCDDGNQLSNDGCSSICQAEALKEVFEDVTVTDNGDGTFSYLLANDGGVSIEVAGNPGLLDLSQPQFSTEDTAMGVGVSIGNLSLSGATKTLTLPNRFPAALFYCAVDDPAFIAAGDLLVYQCILDANRLTWTEGANGCGTPGAPVPALDASGNPQTQYTCERVTIDGADFVRLRGFSNTTAIGDLDLDEDGVPDVIDDKISPREKPDLSIRTFEFVPGVPPTLRVQVVNSGGTATAPSILRLTVGVKGTPVPATRDVTIPALRTGESAWVPVSVRRALPRDRALEESAFRLTVDATHVVAESDETNNEVWHEGGSGRPDLGIRQLRFDKRTPRTVRVQIVNSGDATARASVLRFTLTQAKGSPTRNMMRTEVGSLGAGQARWVTVRAGALLAEGLDLEDTAFAVTIDSTGVVEESDEDNNERLHTP